MFGTASFEEGFSIVLFLLDNPVRLGWLSLPSGWCPAEVREALASQVPRGMYYVKLLYKFI